ncbi:hypothetical protein RFI_24439 [Reticulomyxa filosa]|uniref:Uncharacterized protein n=1 Tax=Reticulomyxa filosa TaxID=46433 RepID=X6MG08_RETFI|nr:hypothetical protein RFI_24439 [Reticulomyxa filosa]|eukprot:ETO12933.1 hypothetical protein RFI_24439 [Reticulomyxa filosa]
MKFDNFFLSIFRKLVFAYKNVQFCAVLNLYKDRARKKFLVQSKSSSQTFKEKQENMRIWSFFKTQKKQEKLEVKEALEEYEQKTENIRDLEDITILLEKEKENYEEFKRLIDDLDNFIRDYDQERASRGRRANKSTCIKFYNELITAMKKTLKWKAGFVKTLTSSTRHINDLIFSTILQETRIRHTLEYIQKNEDEALKLDETKKMITSVLEWSKSVNPLLDNIMHDWSNLHSSFMYTFFCIIKKYANNDNKEKSCAFVHIEQVRPHANKINQNLTKQTETSKWRKYTYYLIGAAVGFILGMVAGAKIGCTIGCGVGGIAGAVVMYGVGGIAGGVAGAGAGALIGAVCGGVKGVVTGVSSAHTTVTKLEQMEAHKNQNSREDGNCIQKKEPVYNSRININNSASNETSNNNESEIIGNIRPKISLCGDLSKTTIEPEFRDGKAFARRQCLLETNAELQKSKTVFDNLKQRIRSDIECMTTSVNKCLKEIEEIEATNASAENIARRLEPYHDKQFWDHILSNMEDVVENGKIMKKKIDSFWSASLDS